MVGERHEQEELGIARTIDKLASEFPHLAKERVTAVVAQIRPRFDGRPIRDFVPLFVERRARAILAAADVAAD